MLQPLLCFLWKIVVEVPHHYQMKSMVIINYYLTKTGDRRLQSVFTKWAEYYNKNAAEVKVAQHTAPTKTSKENQPSTLSVSREVCMVSQRFHWEPMTDPAKDPALESTTVKLSISCVFVVLFVGCKPNFSWIGCQASYTHEWHLKEEKPSNAVKLTADCPRSALLWRSWNDNCFSQV